MMSVTSTWSLVLGRTQNQIWAITTTGGWSPIRAASQSLTRCKLTHCRLLEHVVPSNKMTHVGSTFAERHQPFHRQSFGRDVRRAPGAP